MENNGRAIALGEPRQIGFVVRDARKTAALLTSLLGVGPFHFEDWPPADRPEFTREYRGRPGAFRTLLAFANMGGLEIELIQNVEGESDYQDHLQKHGQSIHHLLFEVDDLDQVVCEFAERGIGVTMGATGRRPGTRWVLLDTVDLLGCALEIRNRPCNQAGVD